MTHGGSEHSFKVSALSLDLTVVEKQCLEDWEERDHLINYRWPCNIMVCIVIGLARAWKYIASLSLSQEGCPDVEIYVSWARCFLAIS